MLFHSYLNSFAVIGGAIKSRRTKQFTCRGRWKDFEA
jgi:hypothetical protein